MAVKLWLVRSHRHACFQLIWLFATRSTLFARQILEVLVLADPKTFLIPLFHIACLFAFPFLNGPHGSNPESPKQTWLVAPVFSQRATCNLKRWPWPARIRSAEFGLSYPKRPKVLRGKDAPRINGKSEGETYLDVLFQSCFSACLLHVWRPLEPDVRISSKQPGVPKRNCAVAKPRGPVPRTRSPRLELETSSDP